MTLPTFAVQVAFADAPLTTPAGGDWIDISAYVRGIGWTRGRNHELARTQAGTVSVRLDNTDRRFDPSNAASPYTPNLVPMRRVRVRATVAGVTSEMFQGFVENWEQQWPVRPLGGGGDAECVITAVDAFKVLSLFDLNAYSKEVLADGPIGYWRLRDPVATSVALDEGQAAASGVYHGVALGGAGPLAGGSTVGTFDGAASFVDVGAAATGLNPTGDLTLEFWMKA
ncbi:MAG TPA: hypothetical protein VEN82_05625, partial [Actinomycetota bacterium]|nr:hypothetical protein [Actinomycetota bacterium]